jgi:hypothetical protein
MDNLGEHLKPTILLFRTDPETVRGACLLVHRGERRRPLGRRPLYLNTAAEQDGSNACVEFNTLLCERGYELSMALRLREYLEEISSKLPWQEFRVSGFVDGPAFDSLQTAFQDLKRANPINEPAVAQSATSRRVEPEDLRIERASTLAEALECFDELVSLRHANCRVRGVPDPSWARDASHFHRDSQFLRQLIARCFPVGEVQLFRIREHEQTIACIYNLVFGSAVYLCQCGSVGTMSESDCVDLIANETGDPRYATRFADDRRALRSAAWRAPTKRVRALELLRTAKHWREQLRANVVAAVQLIRLKVLPQP